MCGGIWDGMGWDTKLSLILNSFLFLAPQKIKKIKNKKINKISKQVNARVGLVIFFGACHEVSCLVILSLLLGTYLSI